MREAEIVLGIDDPILQEEVLHFLDRLPDVRVAGAVADPVELSRRVREVGADSAVVSPGVLEESATLDGAEVLVVSGSETTDALRTALRGGARGFFVWPEERADLARSAARLLRPRNAGAQRSGRVVAVLGARGGAGATFVATSLVGAFARRGLDAVLADLDGFRADVGPALGLPGDANVPTIHDLAAAGDDTREEHLDRVLHADARGFRVLFAPHETLVGGGLEPRALRAAIEAMRSRFEAVVLQLPPCADDVASVAIDAADDVLLVLTLDVIAIRDAKRVLTFVDRVGARGKCRLVINRATRGEIVPRDAERVLEVPVAAVLPESRAVARAQNRGELVIGRSRLSRRILALAAALRPAEAA